MYVCVGMLGRSRRISIKKSRFFSMYEQMYTDVGMDVHLYVQMFVVCVIVRVGECDNKPLSK